MTTYSDDSLKQIFDTFDAKYNEPLSKYTTWKIGGPGDIVVEAKNSNQLATLVQKCLQNNLPYTILGGGSNVLISDEGLRGVVIINKSRNAIILDSNTDSTTELNQESLDQYNIYVPPRHGEEGEEFYSFSDLDYQESGPRVKVQFDSGMDLSYAIAWTIREGVTGLQWFAGIPGTVGGALYNNVHGGTKHFSDNFLSATVLMPSGEVKSVDGRFFNFGYDQSALREIKGLVVLDVTLNLYRGDQEKAKLTANEWTKRKRIQPRVTAGCCFKNLSNEVQAQLQLPSPSIGYLNDKVFGLRGKRVGGAQISERHAAFIENVEQAKASEVIELMRMVKAAAKDKLGVDLEPEISLLGFEKDPLQ